MKESQAAGISVLKYDKYSRGAKDYYTLSKEIISCQEVSLEKISKKFKEVTSKKVKELKEVTFSFSAPTARSVFVVGNFNNWAMNDETLLDKNDGVWSKKLKLQHGTYQYRFVVDGQWIEDPINPEIEKNPYGEYNSILDLK